MATRTATSIETIEGEIPESMTCIKKLKAAPGLELVEGTPVPTIGPTDCLIHVTHAGVCGTDRHIFEWDAWASSRVPVGVTTGHEFVGRVAAVGSACTNFKVGDRVSGEGHIGCGRCPACDLRAKGYSAYLATPDDSGPSYDT